MRVVIQRALEAAVEIDNKEYASIGKGLVVLLGIEPHDDVTDVEWLVSKIIHLRIFNDDSGVMNHSVKDINGEVLIISQFTLHASTRKGNRPSYIKAARPEISKPLYEQFITETRQQITTKVATGSFGADMKVQLINDGPVTIIIDSRNKE